MKKVLIANRGEIACRIIRSCRDLGVSPVAVFSEADRQARHVALADEAVFIGSSRPAESYLLPSAILDAAEQVGADAVHPGYGFLSENSQFASETIHRGIGWIGPSPEIIADMGDKDRARQLAVKAGVPVLSGSRRFATGELAGIDAAAREIGYPILVKASAGGGGIGMQRVDSADDLRGAAERTQLLAQRAFGDGTVFLEKYIQNSRHIEVQIFGFGDGRVIHLFERECSIQRRFQKVIEESPAPHLPVATRSKMIEAALALGRQEGYLGAGTVEFILDTDSDEFAFLEMNTRIQVEHPITEAVTGADLVTMQISLALGMELSHLTQEAFGQQGAAIECRLYAEKPDRGFLPSPGTLTELSFPDEQPGIRIDSGVVAGDVITPFYDPMIAKIIAYGSDRNVAVERMQAALAAVRVEGIVTNLDFLSNCVNHSVFVSGTADTAFIGTYLNELIVKQQ